MVTSQHLVLCKSPFFFGWHYCFFMGSGDPIKKNATWYVCIIVKILNLYFILLCTQIYKALLSQLFFYQIFSLLQCVQWLSQKCFRLGESHPCYSNDHNLKLFKIFTTRSVATTNVTGILVFIAWIKLFKYISFNKTMTQLSNTLARVINLFY